MIKYARLSGRLTILEIEAGDLNTAFPFAPLAITKPDAETGEGSEQSSEDGHVEVQLYSC